MGLPGAGKSTLADSLVAAGYERLNRDEAGGSLRQLLPALDRCLASDRTLIVLDNTYVSPQVSSPAIQAALERGLRIRCVWLSTTVEDAQINAATRMVSRYGRLLGPEEMAGRWERTRTRFAPTVQFRYQRELEPPETRGGLFSRSTSCLRTRPRRSFTNRAVIVWCDGVLVRSRSGRRSPLVPDDAEVFGASMERSFAATRMKGGCSGLSWQPDIAAETLSVASATAIFDRVHEKLGVPIEVRYCPHGGGPPACWCRKPLPGLGVVIQRHRLDPARCLYVGNGPQDPGFARRLGFKYVDAATFFAPEALE